MSQTTFNIYLDDRLQNQLRIRFNSHKGKIINFVVQYESIINKKWIAIVRYDCAHGFFHRDRLFPDGSKEKKAINEQDLGYALNFARQDLEDRWEWYLEHYLIMSNNDN